MPNTEDMTISQLSVFRDNPRVLIINVNIGVGSINITDELQTIALVHRQGLLYTLLLFTRTQEDPTTWTTRVTNTFGMHNKMHPLVHRTSYLVTEQMFEQNHKVLPLEYSTDLDNALDQNSDVYSSISNVIHAVLGIETIPVQEGSAGESVKSTFLYLNLQEFKDHDQGWYLLNPGDKDKRLEAWPTFKNNQIVSVDNKELRILNPPETRFLKYKFRNWSDSPQDLEPFLTGLNVSPTVAKTAKQSLRSGQTVCTLTLFHRKFLTDDDIEPPNDNLDETLAKYVVCGVLLMTREQPHNEEQPGATWVSVVKCTWVNSIPMIPKAALHQWLWLFVIGRSSLTVCSKRWTSFLLDLGIAPLSIDRQLYGFEPTNAKQFAILEKNALTLQRILGQRRHICKEDSRFHFELASKTNCMRQGFGSVIHRNTDRLLGSRRSRGRREDLDLGEQQSMSSLSSEEDVRGRNALRAGSASSQNSGSVFAWPDDDEQGGAKTNPHSRPPSSLNRGQSGGSSASSRNRIEEIPWNDLPSLNEAGNEYI